MTIAVNGPNGVTINFPDGTDHETINRVMLEAVGGGDKYGRLSEPQADDPALADALKRKAVEANDPGLGSSILQSAASGLTFGFAPRIRAGVRSALGLGEYDQELEAANTSLENARAAHPIASTAAEIAGAVVSPLSKIGAAAKGAGMAARVAGGARQGAVGGALYGASQAPDLGNVGDVAERAVTGGAVGGTVGGALGTIGRKAAAVPAPDVAAAAERVGVSLPIAAATDSLAVRSAGALAKQGPFGTGAPLQRAAERAVTDLGGAAERTAAGYGGGAAADAAGAGAAARAALEDYVGPVTSQKADALYKKVGGLVNAKTETPLTNTAGVVARITAERGAAALDESGAAAQVAEALARPNGLTYAGIQKLRTSIGEQVDTGILPAGMSKGELKQIYGALTRDLEAAVQRSGGQQAQSAFQRANTYYRLVSERRANLAKILGTKSDEGVFAAILQKAGSTSGADAKVLAQARKSMPPEEWNKIASAAIGRLGGEGEKFSPLKFMTAYEKLSPAGKRLLFRSGGQEGLANALDDIATVSKRFRQLESLRNTSNTGPLVLGGLAISQAFAAPVQTAGAVLGAMVMSRVLAQPATAKALAKWSRAYTAFVAAPSTATLNAAKAASRQFASMIGKELGLTEYVAQMGKALADVLTPADPNNNGGPANQGRQEQGQG